MKGNKTKNRISGCSFSLQGLDHIIMGNRPCEDSSFSQRFRCKKEHEYVLIGIADGVGSCRCSRIASNRVIEVVHHQIVREIKAGITPDCIMIERAMQAAHDALISTAEELNLPNTDELGTTLDIVLMDENGKAFIGHNGDGGIIILHRTGAIESTAKMNTPSGAVYTVDWESKDKKHAWAIHVTHNVAAIFVATDGIYDYLTDSGSGFRPEFLRQNHFLESWKKQSRLRRTASRLMHKMIQRTPSVLVTGDDITLAMAGFPGWIEPAAKKAGII